MAEADPLDVQGELVTVELDDEVCIGVGQCELLESDVFRLDDSGVSVVLGDGRLPRHRAEIVVDQCPSNAISISEDQRQ